MKFPSPTSVIARRPLAELQIAADVVREVATELYELCTPRVVDDTYRAYGAALDLMYEVRSFRDHEAECMTDDMVRRAGIVEPSPHGAGCACRHLVGA
jgi:hypothetical protein